MKIVLYTSSTQNAVDRFNISRLVSSFPNFDYLVVKVLRDAPAPISPVRRLLVRLKHGRNELSTDTQRVFDNIDKLERGVAIHCKTIEVDSVNDNRSEMVIRDFKPDILLQCGAGILKENIFMIPKIATINVHHGFAPEVRGVSSILWGMYYGLPIGVTVHVIDKNIDTGAILAQFRFDWNGESYEAVYENCIVKGAQLLVETVEFLANGWLETASSVATETESFYFSSFDFRNYAEFKKAGWKPQPLPSEKKRRLKIKTVIRCKK